MIVSQNSSYLLFLVHCNHLYNFLVNNFSKESGSLTLLVSTQDPSGEKNQPLFNSRTGKWFLTMLEKKKIDHNPICMFSENWHSKSHRCMCVYNVYVYIICVCIYLHIYIQIHTYTYFLSILFTVYHVVISNFHCISNWFGLFRNLSTNCQIVIPFTFLVLKLSLDLVHISFLLLWLCT